MATAPVDEDADVRAALDWLIEIDDGDRPFVDRLVAAQAAYREFTGRPENFGKDPRFGEFSTDWVASYFAQAKSILEERRTFDQRLAGESLPWMKQLGRNIHLVDDITGARERAARMLRSDTVAPDSAMFELVMATNYATQGFGVEFIAEGAAKSPDIRLTHDEAPEPLYVECKRLGQGQYEKDERAHYGRQFAVVSPIIEERGLSIHLDVTYTEELRTIPDDYLAVHLQQALASPIAIPGGYPWKDAFGYGKVRAANVPAARADIRNGSLYFGTKLARLLSGGMARETTYSLVVGARGDDRDPRFLDEIYYGSVITWECVAPEAISRKSRYVKGKLVEADRQLQAWGPGIVHMAMDMALECESSDVRRAKNHDAVSNFRPRSELPIIYLHCLVPRISEDHSWFIDETVDTFAQTTEPMDPMRIFPYATLLENDLPSWRQQIQAPDQR